MRFSVDELLKAGKHKWKKEEIDSITLRNLEDLCRKLNKLGFVPPRTATSCLRSLADQKRINPSAMGSSHLYGAAVDIGDADGKLKAWLQTDTGNRALINCGLWAEDYKSTDGWVHLQLYAPSSFNRVFKP
ncbi:MAG: hypothetical protein IKT32_02225 [Clostridia bacterium]|nr:hypothetical protein [Clostridia bacterium]